MSIILLFALNTVPVTVMIAKKNSRIDMFRSKLIIHYKEIFSGGRLNSPYGKNNYSVISSVNKHLDIFKLLRVFFSSCFKSGFGSGTIKCRKKYFCMNPFHA